MVQKPISASDLIWQETVNEIKSNIINYKLEEKYENKRMLTALVITLLSVTAVMAKDIRTAVFKVSQMHCENCERKVKNNIKFEKGVKEFSTDLKTRTVSITYDADKTNVEKLKAGFKKFNYEAEFVEETKQAEKK